MNGRNGSMPFCEAITPKNIGGGIVQKLSALSTQNRSNYLFRTLYRYFGIKVPYTGDVSIENTRKTGDSISIFVNFDSPLYPHLSGNAQPIKDIQQAIQNNIDVLDEEVELEIVSKRPVLTRLRTKRLLEEMGLTLEQLLQTLNSYEFGNVFLKDVDGGIMIKTEAMPKMIAAQFIDPRNNNVRSGAEKILQNIIAKVNMGVADSPRKETPSAFIPKDILAFLASYSGKGITADAVLSLLEENMSNNSQVALKALRKIRRSCKENSNDLSLRRKLKQTQAQLLLNEEFTNELKHLKAKYAINPT